MRVEYATPEGVTVKRTMNQTELLNLLQSGGVVLLSVNRQPVKRRRRRKPEAQKVQKAL